MFEYSIGVSDDVGRSSYNRGVALNKDDNTPDDFELVTRPRVQFPLSVFFELTGLVALISLCADTTGTLTAMALGAMAISILLRQGIPAMVCFALAMFSATSDASGTGFFISVGLGCLIASWPVARAKILFWLGFRSTRA